MARVQIQLRDPELRARREQERAGGKHQLDAGHAYQVLIDGREIDLVTSVSIEWSVDGVPRAELCFFVEDLAIDDEALAALQVCVRKRKQPGGETL